MLFGYVYETGMRMSNQDALLFRSTLLSQGELCMAVVCDGMGGEECGERASYECVCALDDWFDQELLPVFTKRYRSSLDKMKLIKSKGIMAFHDMNRRLFTNMRKQKGKMGTTASVLILYNHDFYIFHIGDSRVYFALNLFGKTIFLRKTKDHTSKYKLTRCLGLNKEYKPDFCYGKTWCKHFLLCSDGFWKNYDYEIWRNCLDTKYMTEDMKMNKRLKELAMDNLKKGMKDNISALWITGNNQK